MYFYNKRDLRATGEPTRRADPTLPGPNPCSGGNAASDALHFFLNPKKAICKSQDWHLASQGQAVRIPSKKHGIFLPVADYLESMAIFGPRYSLTHPSHAVQSLSPWPPLEMIDLPAGA